MAKVASVGEVFTRMGEVFQPGQAAGVNATYQFDLGGDNGGKYWVKVENGNFSYGEGETDNPSTTVIATADDYISIVNGDTAAMSAFMTGKLKVKGDMGLALKLQSMFPTG